MSNKQSKLKSLLAHTTHTSKQYKLCGNPLPKRAWAASKLARSFSMELSSADQIEQEFADELQSMSLQEEEAAPVKKPSLGARLLGN